MAENEDLNSGTETSEKTSVAEPTEDQMEAFIQKRYGVPSTELIPKAQQIKVLTPEEKAEADETKKRKTAQYALENKFYTTTEQEEYIAAQQSDKVDLLRKKYIEDHPNDKKAGKTFDRIYRLDEDDQFDDGETQTPNEEKKAAREILDQQADQYLNTKFAKIKDAPNRYEQHLEMQAVITKNTELVTKVIAEIPKKFEIKTAEDTYQIPVTAEDIAEATKMISESGLLTKKGVDVAEVKENITLFFKSKRLNDIIAEVENVTKKKTVAAMERGAKGVDVLRATPANGTGTAFDEFNKKMGIGPI